MYCRNCGKKMPDHYVFCTNCGERLVSGNDSVRDKNIILEETPDPSWDSAFDPAPDPSWEPAYDPTPEPNNAPAWEARESRVTPEKTADQNTEKQEKTSGTAWKITALCLAAALLVTAGVVIAWLLNRDRTSEPSYTESPVESDGGSDSSSDGQNGTVIFQPTTPTPSAAVSVEPSTGPVWVVTAPPTATPYSAEPSAEPVWVVTAPPTATPYSAKPSGEVGGSASVQPAPFYGIWCAASTDPGIAEKARQRLADAGLDAQTYVTTDWSNLNREKHYVVTAGTYSSYSAAEAMLPTVQKVVKGAYIKYTGDWLGTTWPNAPLSASTFAGWLGSYNQRSFSGAYASSELVEDNIRFSASYAIDSSINRPWVEGVSGSGIGETLTLYFPHETTVSVIDLTLGYARDTQRYYNNNRPSLLRFSFSDGSSFDFGFWDEMTDQAIELNWPVSTTYIQITILDVYYGTVNDTCIYLVKAYG